MPHKTPLKPASLLNSFVQIVAESIVLIDAYSQTVPDLIPESLRPIPRSAVTILHKRADHREGNVKFVDLAESHSDALQRLNLPDRLATSLF